MKTIALFNALGKQLRMLADLLVQIDAKGRGIFDQLLVIDPVSNRQTDRFVASGCPLFSFYHGGPPPRRNPLLSFYASAEIDSNHGRTSNDEYGWFNLDAIGAVNVPLGDVESSSVGTAYTIPHISIIPPHSYP
jgi:hypothetical protein